MNPATETPIAEQNGHLVSAMANARGAIQTLSDRGFSVYAVVANGRRPVLMVDRIPDELVSVVKRRSPNGRGGHTVVRATEWSGCQLESMHDEMPESARVHLCGRPVLEVVRG